MSKFNKVAPGTQIDGSIVENAAWVNAVSAAAEYHQRQLGGGGVDSNRHSLVNPIKVRNLTGANRVRGDVVQVGDALLSPFDPRNPWFQGNVYDAAEPRPIAILVKAAVEDEIVEAAITGLCVARVDVQATTDRYAVPDDGQVTLKSTASPGAIEIISPLSTTGVQEVFVVIGAASQITVYEFNNCETPARKLYLDNADIGDHEAGEVAVIRLDGVIECWQLIGPAPQCKTGACAEILSWGANCDACSVCFYLTPCGGGSPTFVRGIEWYEYVDRVVKLDGPGHEGCYTVAEADGCFDVDDALGVEHITDDYANCDGCGCYEVENCADSGDVSYVSGDLASVVGAASGAASISSFVKRRGVCYEITGFADPCGTTPDEWDIDEVEEIASCGGCCYALTNCDDPEDVEYYRLSSSDTVDPNDFLNDDGTSNGRVLMLTGYVCRTWSVPEECPESGVTLGLPTILEEFDSCDECVITCWKKCGTSTYIRTYSDMKEVGPNAAVKRAEDGFCYVRETSPGTCGTPSIVIFTIETIIDEGEDSCTICETPRVKLTPACGSSCSDCAGSSSGGSGSGRSVIVTDNAALFGAVDQYIKNDGACYLVSWTTDALTGTLGCWTGPYASCGACNDAPSTLTVIALVGGEHKNVKIQGSFNICGESALSECE